METQNTPDILKACITSLAERAKTDPEDARASFDSLYRAAETAGASPDALATIELLREYHCNPTFRSAVNDHVFEVTYRA